MALGPRRGGASASASALTQAPSRLARLWIASWRSRAWDCDRLLEIMRRHPGVVCAVLCGHEHRGGYAYDAAARTHHLTCCSPLNKGSAGSAFGALAVFTDRIEVSGPAVGDLVPVERVAAAAAQVGSTMLVLPLAD